MATKIVVNRFELGDLVVVNRGEYRGVIGVVESYSNDAVSIDDCNGGVLTLPESHLNGVTKEAFFKMLVATRNKVFYSEVSK